MSTFAVLGTPALLIFVPIDYLLFPDYFASFLAARLLVAIAFVSLFLLRRSPYALAGVTLAQLGIALLVAGIIAVDPSGVQSAYTPGLIFVFAISPVLVPLSPLQVAIANVPALITFLTLPQLLHPVGALTYLLEALFPTLTLLIGLGSAVVLDRYRFSEFLRRREIERARDELRELDAAKSRFTANVHHELRTPLTLILAPLEAMLAGGMGDLPEPARGMLDSMRSNAVRLLKLINNLLDLAQIESRQMRIQRRPLRIDKVVREIVGSAQGLAERKRISLVASVEPDTPQIHADVGSIEKILVNLIGNALKFTDTEGRVEVNAAAAQGSGLHLWVADTGIGIPDDQLGRVFDRFAQVDMSEGRSYEGTGIGLSLVRELVELHGGSAWAESPGAGRGATLHVLLPVGQQDAPELDPLLEDEHGHQLDLERAFGDTRGAAASDAPPSAAESASLPAPADEPGATAAEVLIVEDNADMRHLLRSLLSAEFRVRLARNGFEALAAVQAARPDVVLSDVMMPGMTGLELTSALKESPETADVPVILVTSKADREMRVEGLERGADDYVSKPFHPRELLARVRTLARLRMLQCDLERKNHALEMTLDELEQAKAAGATEVRSIPGSS